MQLVLCSGGISCSNRFISFRFGYVYFSNDLQKVHPALDVSMFVDVPNQLFLCIHYIAICLIRLQGLARLT